MYINIYSYTCICVENFICMSSQRNEIVYLCASLIKYTKDFTDFLFICIADNKCPHENTSLLYNLMNRCKCSCKDMNTSVKSAELLPTLLPAQTLGIIEPTSLDMKYEHVAFRIYLKKDIQIHAIIFKQMNITTNTYTYKSHT